MRRSSYWPNTRVLIDLYGNMLKRCQNPTDKCFSYYGGRGINVCSAWLEDRNKFYDWVMSAGWNRSLQIDRIDVNGDYSPDNCRLVDRVTNMNNKRNNINITFNGETLTVAQWEKKLGLQRNAIYQRIHNGWEPKRALSEPFRRYGAAL